MFSLWLTHGINVLLNYNIGGGSWVQVSVSNSMIGGGARAATDPTTKFVYFSGGGQTLLRVIGI